MALGLLVGVSGWAVMAEFWRLIGGKYENCVVVGAVPHTDRWEELRLCGRKRTVEPLENGNEHITLTWEPRKEIWVNMARIILCERVDEVESFEREPYSEKKKGFFS